MCEQEKAEKTREGPLVSRTLGTSGPLVGELPPIVGELRTLGRKPLGRDGQCFSVHWEFKLRSCFDCSHPTIVGYERVPEAQIKAGLLLLIIVVSVFALVHAQIAI